MPSYVIPEKCDGCKAVDKTACQYVCPNDLMVLDKETEKAYNQEPEMCWECYCCVKICPTQAVDVRGYQDFVSDTDAAASDIFSYTISSRSSPAVGAGVCA